MTAMYDIPPSTPPRVQQYTPPDLGISFLRVWIFETWKTRPKTRRQRNAEYITASSHERNALFYSLVRLFTVRQHATPSPNLEFSRLIRFREQGV